MMILFNKKRNIWGKQIKQIRNNCGNCQIIHDCLLIASIIDWGDPPMLPKLLICFFTRDIKRFLNSDIESVYNLVKQLPRIFPAFFNETGTEGTLQYISTELDGDAHRKNLLIHFF